MILVQYNVDGTINDIKPLDNSIFSCTMSAEDIVNFMSFKSLFTRICSKAKTFTKEYLYEIYVRNFDGSLA